MFVIVYTVFIEIVFVPNRVLHQKHPHCEAYQIIENLIPNEGF